MRIGLLSSARSLLRNRKGPVHFRRLGLESLKNRKLLATIEVTTFIDDNAPGGEVSLREAIAIANTTPTVDEIVFDPTVLATPRTTNLDFGELQISKPLIITGPGKDKSTINAGGNSRVLHYSSANPDRGANPTSGDLSVSGLTMTGGKISSGVRGGAGILFESDGTGLLTDGDGGQSPLQTKLVSVVLP